MATIKMLVLIGFCTLLMAVQNNLAYAQPEQTQKTWRAIVFSPQGLKSPPVDFLPNFERLVDEALAPMGINVIIFDMHWHNFQFTCREELKAVNLPSSRAFAAADAGKMAAICRKHNIRVMVGMNFLTHQNHGQLLSAFPQFKWPDNPRLWNPLNPDVNQVAFDMADELIDAFQAEAIHVGMDEAWGFKLDTLPGAESYTPATLFAKCVNDYYDHFVKHRGIPMLMWADMLEGDRQKLNTADAAELIPKDIILCYWEYRYRDQYPWLQQFIDKGFRVLACPWKGARPAKSLVGAAKRIDNPKMLGVLYTTWCGRIRYDLRPALLREGKQDKLDAAARGVADAMRSTLPMLRE